MNPGRFPVVPPLVALALAACAGESPTASAPPAAAVARGPSLVLSGEQLGELRVAVSDANTRLLPMLGGAAHARLRSALAATDAALASDDAAALASTLAEARDAVAAERALLGPDAAEAPDLDAILLMLDGLQAAVPASLTPAVAPAPAS